MQYNRLTSETALAEALKKLQKSVNKLETKGTGTIAFVDELTGTETIIGTLPDGSTGVEQFVGDTTPPPVATLPFVSAQPGNFVVTWDGLFVGGAEKPRDFVHVNVIAHKMDNTTTLLSVPVGVIRLTTESVLVTTDIAAGGEFWQFSFESEDYNGNKAVESTRTSSLMMIDAISPVSEAWTDLKDEVLLATNTSASAQIAADTAQDAADAAKLAADKALESSSKTYRRSGKDATGIVISSGLTPTAMVSVASDGAPGGFALQKTGASSGNVYDMSGIQDFNPDLLYRITFKVRVVVDSTVLPKTIYAGILGLKADGLTGVSVAGVNSWTNAHYFAASNASLVSTDGWKTYTGYFKGHAASGNGGLHPNPLDPGTVHTDVRKVVPLAFLDYASGNGTWQVGSIELDVITSEAQKALSDAAAAQLKADQAFNNAETAADAAGDAQTAADGKAKSWYTETPPAGIGHSVGDMWFDPNNGHRLSTWDGDSWITTQDAALAQEIAESKGRTYTQAFAPPVEARLPQNLWIDTTAGVNLSVTKFWDPTAAAGVGAWVPVKDAEIDAAEVRAANDAKAKADAAAIAAINAQAYSKNASFDDWTGSAPALFSNYGTGPTKETSIYLTGPNAARFNCVDTTTDRGLNFSGILNHAPNLEYFTVEISFQLVSGTSLNGAGVLLDWTGLTPARTRLKLVDEVPAPVTGKWYRISKTLRRPTATGTWTTMDGYLMANYQSGTELGNKTVKDIIFDWMNIRPATAEEILAYTAPTTSYVDQAEADAILAASTDATTKATNAQNAAIADTTTRLLTKNKTVWSTSPATGTSGYIAADTWFQRDGTGAVIAQWEYTTTPTVGWQPRTVSEDVIGNLSAGKIIYGTMSGDRIDSNTITSKHIFIGDFENLSPELAGVGNWSLGAVTVDNAVTPFEDAKMLTYATPNVWASATTNTTTKAKVSGGDQLAWSYRYKKAGDATASGTVSLRLLFEKADGTLLQRLYLSSYSAAAPTGTYVQGTATAYDGSSTVRLEMVVSGASGTTSPTYVGDIKLRRMTAGNLIVDGAINGKTITGPTIQTEDTANRGIKLTPTEFMGYDGTTGNKAFSLTSGGTLSLKGSLQSGSSIAGAVLTGAGIETISTPLRGVKMDSLGIKAYNGSGDLTFSVNAATGEVEAPGIKANSIEGDVLKAGSVSAKHMRIGDFTNLITNGFGDLGAGVGWGANLIYDTVDKPSEVTGVFKTTAGQGTTTANLVWADVDPNTEYVTEIWLKSSVANTRIYIELRDQVGVHATAGTQLSPPPMLTQGIYVLQNVVVPTVWTKFTVKSVTTATATKVKIDKIYFNHPNGTATNGVISMAIAFRRRVGGSLIVDGAIRTEHMQSGTIDAGVLSAGSVTATELKSKSIGTDKLLISSTDNLILEADFGNGGSSWGLPATYKSIDVTGGRGSATALKITGVASAVTLFNIGNKIPIPADARFRGAMWVKSSIAAVANSFKIIGRFWTSNVAYTDIDIATSPAVLAGTWTKVEGIVPATIPNTAIAAEFYIRSANTSTTQVVHVDFVSVTRAAAGNLIVDGAITADKLESKLILTSEIIAGPEAGTHATMDPSGFKVYTKNAVAGQPPQETVSMGVDGTGDLFALTDATGSKVVNMDDSGTIAAKSLEADNTLYYKGEELTSYVGSRPKGMVAWAQIPITTNMSVNNGTIGLFELAFDGGDIPARMYELNVNTFIASVVGTGTTGMRLFYTTDGTAPTINSPTIQYNYTRVTADGFVSMGGSRIIGSNNGNYIRVLVAMYSNSRSTVTLDANQTHLYATVMDLGESIPATGVASTGGGIPYTGSTVAPPVIAKVTKTVEYGYTSVKSYLPDNSHYQYNIGKGYQGLSPAGIGNLRSIYSFSQDFVGLLNGATIEGVWVYAYFEHWYYNAGGTAKFRFHNQSGAPNSYTGVTGNGMDSGGWPKAAGRWVNVPSSLWAGFASGAYKGFALIGDSTYTTYGIANNARIKFKYTK